ncbi:glycine, alanine and asparagine-rich protein-like isoform X2 [Spodoptera frugiperda]|uniref:Glycine, alanine and asparagine-rich protein-like isoform X2 n=1 Tax=Spodoptera frugiperda TaxID=7108 RepID=A0A9R0DXB9_SPOFR|nr:glycine, alanine and asparagine-rich protein-like isoform X2 [Spodoptera frugiperda]
MARSVALLLVVCLSIVSIVAVPWSFYNFSSFIYGPQQRVTVPVATSTVSSTAVNDNVHEYNIGIGGVSYGTGNAGNGGNFNNLHIGGTGSNTSVAGIPTYVFNLGNGENGYGSNNGGNGGNFTNITIGGVGLEWHTQQ